MVFSAPPWAHQGIPECLVPSYWMNQWEVLESHLPFQLPRLQGEMPLRVSSWVWERGRTTIASAGVFLLQFLQQKSLDTIAEEASCIVFSSSSITAPGRYTTREKNSFIWVSSRQCLSRITGAKSRTYELQGQSKGPQKPPFHPFPVLSISILFKIWDCTSARRVTLHASMSM